jgi:Fic family protein
MSMTSTWPDLPSTPAPLTTSCPSSRQPWTSKAGPSKGCIAARAALAELNAAVDLIPNPAILINTLPILEARASSEIENIVTTTDQLFRLASDESAAADAATKEALRYRTALWHGATALERRPVGTNVAAEICTTLRGIQTDVRRIPGTRLRHLASGVDVYTPPDGEARLRTLLGNWEQFLHGRPDLDPLIRMAVAHYQFEAIHPFEDGNGRTGRILNLLFLAGAGLLVQPVLYLSRAIIRTKSDYYRLLLGVTTMDDWEPWVLYMLAAVTETAAWTTAKIRAMRHLHRETREHIQAVAPKIYTRELVDAVFEQPYCRISNLVRAGIAKRQTASTYLAKLADAGVLVETPAGRERLFVHRALLDLLSSETHEAPAYVARPAM